MVFLRFVIISGIYEAYILPDRIEIGSKSGMSGSVRSARMEIGAGDPVLEF